MSNCCSPSAASSWRGRRRSRRPRASPPRASTSTSPTRSGSRRSCAGRCPSARTAPRGSAPSPTPGSSTAPTRGLEEELDARFSELDIDADTELVAVDADRFAELKATFESSPWAELKPVEVEREIHLPFDGRTIVCKIDAVYERDGRLEIVDWKTGKAPKDAEDLERKQLQLALYRLAYARWAGVDPELVDAAFYFVAEDRIIRPEHVSSEDELRERWRAALG